MNYFKNLKKAKELGADDYVKRASKLQSAFENVLKKHRQAITDLRNVKSNI